MYENQSSRRLRWLLRCMLVWIAAILGRLLWLQVIKHDDLVKLAQQQQERVVEVPALRGSILDRNGEPLAKSIPAESISVNPQQIADTSVAADLLAGVLNLDAHKLRNDIAKAKAHGSKFLWIKRKIEAAEAERVRTYKLDYVAILDETRRFYPRGNLAAHVVGSTGFVGDEVEERGNAGAELEFDDELAGHPGLARMYTDVRQNAYDSVVTRQPEPGESIKLTIDSNLQYIAQQELAKTVGTSGAKTGSIVAMNPYNGEILVMANYPTFDPNHNEKGSDPPNARSNLAITTPFEPGSVFKVITLTAALEALKYKPETMIPCGSVLRVYDRTIRDEHPHGPFSMAEVLAHSSNVGAVMIGQRVGDKTLYKYQRKFGFGRKTGVDLPGESAGLLKPVEDWSKTTVDFTSFGHEVAVTSLQLAIAGSAIANGGLLVKPRLVLARQKAGQAEEQIAAEPATRIIAPETAIQMREMMEGVVLRGTAKGYANLRGYTSGGKTGTAQIFDLKSHVYTHKYNASFLGFAPVENPQIVIIVTLEGTTGGEAGFGAPVAAPVFRDVATAALRMLDVPKDLPEAPVTASREPAGQHDIASVPSGPAPGLEQRSVSSVTPPPVRVDASARAGASDPEESGNPNRRSFLAAAKPRTEAHLAR